MIVMVNGRALECSLVIAIYRRVPFYLESPEFSVLVFMPGAQAARLHPSPKPMTIGLGRLRASHANTGFNCKNGRRAACAPGKCDGKNSGLSRYFGRVDSLPFCQIVSYSFLRRPENFAFTETGPAGSTLDAHLHKAGTRLELEIEGL